MSEEANSNTFSNGAGEVALRVERIIKETNEDLRNFRQEHAELREQLSAVLEENRFLAAELDKYKKLVSKGSNEDTQEHHELTSDALAKALAQIDTLQNERRSLMTMQECSHRTIKNMEIELKSYRTQMPLGNNNEHMLQKYSKALKKLEAKLTEQQQEIQTQANVIKALHEHKQRCGDQIEHLKSKLKERHLEAALREDNQSKITSLQKHLKEAEKSLKHTRTQLEESIKREAHAMNKIQDALGLSEAAVKERVEAEKRAEAYKEEAAQLATNIGNIMDDAAKRVDNEVAQLKAKLTARDQAIASLRDKLKSDSAAHKAVMQTLETRINRMIQKYKEVLNENSKLEEHLNSYKDRLNELEGASMKDEAQLIESKKLHDIQMVNFLEACKELKAHYKDLLTDLTTKFETEIHNLHKTKCELQVENDLLRRGASGDGNRMLK